METNKKPRSIVWRAVLLCVLAVPFFLFGGFGLLLSFVCFFGGPEGKMTATTFMASIVWFIGGSVLILIGGILAGYGIQYFNTKKEEREREKEDQE